MPASAPPNRETRPSPLIAIARSALTSRNVVGLTNRGVSHGRAEAASSDVDDGGGGRPGEAHAERKPHDLKGTGRPSPSWRVEPSSPPATWTIEEYTIGDLVSVRP